MKTTVTQENTAKTLGSGSLDVFATPAMVALMEKAACASIAHLLNEGETSVGTLINVAHKAATPLGREVTATATITAQEGRKVTFEVTAHDGVNEIGAGTHERFIVNEAKFLSRL